MKYERDRTWAEVSLDHLASNFQKLSEWTGPACDVLCVVKGNAYGHGAIEVSRELERVGCRILGVATLEEAMELREAGIRLPVLLLGPIPPSHTALAMENNLILPLIDEAYAREVSAAAVSAGRTLRAHLKIDTGMSRYGLPVSKDMDGYIAEALRIVQLPNMQVSGVFTHFAAAGDPYEDDFTRRQMGLFRIFSERMEAAGVKLIRHCANSPATIRFPQAHYDMIRTGTLLYGFNPFGRLELEPVMELKTRITQIKHLAPGDTVGYGRLFTCRRPTDIAIVPFGFVDGIHRSASNKAYMLVNGKPAKIVGKICMDLCFLDVTGIEDVAVGQIVTVFGWDHGVYQSAYALTDAYPGSAPELTAVLGTRVPRFYLRNQEVVACDQKE